MNWEVAQAPTQPMQPTYWWGWAGLAVAIHVAVALSLWWLAQNAPSVGGVVVTKNEASAPANANEQRLVWVSRADVTHPGEQAGHTLDKVRLQARAEPLATPPITAPARVVQPRAEQLVPVAAAISGQAAGAQAVVKPLQAPVAQSEATSVANAEAVSEPSDQVSPALSAAGSVGATIADARVGASAAHNRAPHAVQASSPPPDYPALSRRLGEQGEVVLRVQVSAGGHALTVELAKPSGFDRLDRAALQAVGRWRFVPAMANGQLLTAWFEVPVRFELR
ncbi:MAG: energy transducer TonB [Burkholderiaceae bacterium]